MGKTIAGLEADQVVTVTRSSSEPLGVDSIELSEAERESGRENYDFYCFLIWPFIEAAWLGAMSLMMLTPPVGLKGDVWLEVSKVQERAQLVSARLFSSLRLSGIH